MFSTHRLCFLRSKCLHWIFLSSFLCSLCFGGFCLVWYLVCIFFPFFFLTFSFFLVGCDAHRYIGWHVFAPLSVSSRSFTSIKSREHKRRSRKRSRESQGTRFRGSRIQEGHSLNWEFQAKWGKSIFRGHLKWNPADRVVAHVTLHICTSRLCYPERRVACASREGLGNPKGLQIGLCCSGMTNVENTTALSHSDFIPVNWG